MNINLNLYRVPRAIIRVDDLLEWMRWNKSGDDNNRDARAYTEEKILSHN